MNTQIRQTLIISRDAAFAAACGKELEIVLGNVRTETVASPGEAEALARLAPPQVILLDETALGIGANGSSPESQELEVVATRLAGVAPVIVLAAPEQQWLVASLLATGAADFVARAGHFLPVALSLLERRLRSVDQETAAAQPASRSSPAAMLEVEPDFGEVLRHELNNPLTGILGNAELLLAEVRRRNDGRLPQGAQRRLETITDLAVRLRETVRRLGQQWEARHDHARSAS